MRLGANHKNEQRVRKNSMSKFRDVMGRIKTKIYCQATVSDVLQCIMVLTRLPS
jgi:hypothetical protein